MGATVAHAFPKVAGWCPMGCGETLFLGSGGYVTCSYITCPCPDAVATILDNRETEHVVVFEDATFSVKHPLRERVDDELFECGLHGHIASLDGPPAAPGTYRAVSRDLRWHWMKLL